MSDRLAELRRQRALVQQHVEWLDREIAAETARLAPAEAGAKLAAAVVTAAVTTAAPPLSPSPAKPILPTPAAPSGASAETREANPDAERILDEFRVAPGSLHQDVRKGCFLYFAAALALLAAVVAILYFTLPHKEIRPENKTSSEVSR